MNRKSLLSIFLLLALFIGAISYSPALQSPFITTLNRIKNSYFNVIASCNRGVEEYFFQAKQIATLRQKLQQCNALELKIEFLTHQLQDLYKENNVNFALNPNFELVHANSYQKFGNFNRLWIEIPDYNSSKIYGLLYKNFVAGIVVNKNNKPLALLNSDIKSTYAVSIGGSKAPGIAHGNSDKNIIVSFIPAWFPIHLGDEVTTSGLDNLFFKGLKVGKVISIKRLQGYQSAIVEPYFRSYEPNYFYIIRSVR